MLLICIICFQVSEILAGPGGKIAKAIFTSPLGKVVLLILTIIFLPLIIYGVAREYFGIRKTKKDLKQLALIRPGLFDEITLKNRITDVFTRVHKGWSGENLEECSEYMSDWYWQNQQIVFLDKWKEINLENICNVKRINSISPLHMRITNEPDYEGSRIMFKIDANMEDYLRNRDSRRVVEGKEGFRDNETVWTLVLANGKWKVDNIEQSEMTIQYAKMENIVPVLGGVKVT